MVAARDGRIAKAVRSSDPSKANHWQRIKTILGGALELPATEQAAFLAEQAVSPQELSELQALIAADQSRHPLLDTSPHALMAEAVQAHISVNWEGREIGPYRLKSLIAFGGMGQVYRAERQDEQLPRDVAIKFMRDGAVDESLQQRFLAERETLARLDHPHLAKLLDSGIAHGVPYFVMELVQGEAIDVYCQRHETTVTQKIALFQTLCQVVHYAHGQGVIHRDLKAANVLVTPDGIVKLVDFGIAKNLANNAQTKTALRVMTLACASPEQIRGQPVTPASDVYSLGVLLYRLLTQKSPYALDTDTDTDSDDLRLRKAICETPPVRPSKAVSTSAGPHELSGNLDAIVMMALRKVPGVRYPSALELSDDLARHLRGEKVHARRGWAYRAGQRILQPRVMAGLAGVATVAVIISGSLAGHAWTELLRQKRLTQQHLSDLGDNLRVVATMRGALADSPGAALALKEVVQPNLAHLDRLSASTRQDIAFNADLGMAYLGWAQTVGGPDGFHLNDGAHAAKIYAQAIDVLLQTISLRPHDAQLQTVHMGLIRAQAGLSRLLQAQGQVKQAQLVARQALLQARQAAQNAPDSDGARRLMAVAQLNLAQILPFKEAGSDLMVALQAALALLEKLHQDAPADATVSEDLAAAHARQAQYLLQGDAPQTDSTARAAAEFAVAIDLLSNQAQVQSQSLGLKMALAMMKSQQAQALFKSLQTDTALDVARQAHDGVRSQWDIAPNHPLMRERFVDVSLSLSQLLFASGAFNDAVHAASQAAETLTASLDDNPGERRLLLKHGIAHFQLARALMARANSAPATGSVQAVPADWLLACQSIRQSLKRLRPLTPRWEGDTLVPDAAELFEMQQVLSTCPNVSGPSKP